MAVINQLPHNTGGSSETETLLWTNPAPTATRAAFDITLSDNLTNYKYLKIQYSYNNSSGVALYYVIFPIINADGTDFMFKSGNGNQRMVIGLMNASGVGYIRHAAVQSDTAIHFSTAYKINTSGTQAGNLIPWYIYGIK